MSLNRFLQIVQNLNIGRVDRLGAEASRLAAASGAGHQPCLSGGRAVRHAGAAEAPATAGGRHLKCRVNLTRERKKCCV